MPQNCHIIRLILYGTSIVYAIFSSSRIEYANIKTCVYIYMIHIYTHIFKWMLVCMCLKISVYLKYLEILNQPVLFRRKRLRSFPPVDLSHFRNKRRLYIRSLNTRTERRANTSKASADVPLWTSRRNVCWWRRCWWVLLYNIDARLLIARRGTQRTFSGRYRRLLADEKADDDQSVLINRVLQL